MTAEVVHDTCERRMEAGTKEVVMGRTGAWVLGAAFAVALSATAASAQVSVAVGVGAPRWGASVIVGGPPVYVVDPYYVPPYVTYPYYEPYYYYPYRVPYGRVYYRSRPYYYGGRPVYYSRAPVRTYRVQAARAYRPDVRPVARVSPARGRYAVANHRR
jgi:hypothetical protein